MGTLRTRRALLAALLAQLCTARLAAAPAEPSPHLLTWTSRPAIPDPLGVAGPFAGASNGAVIVAGGANFPTPVWERTKEWHDAIWVMREDVASGAAADGRAPSSEPRERYRWTRAGSLPHPVAYGAFPRVLGRIARDGGYMTQEEAVRKMTSLPAKQMGLKDRGTLSKGAHADVIVFNPETIIDRATFSDPFQLPEGIEYVLINGMVVVENGDYHADALAGQVIRRGSNLYGVLPE